VCASFYPLPLEAARMAIEKLKKYQDVLKAHLDFIDETEPEDKKEKKHFEKVTKTISLIMGAIESGEIEKIGKTNKDLQESLEKIEELQGKLDNFSSEESVRDLSEVEVLEIEEKIEAKLKSEYEELIMELEIENEKLSKESTESSSEDSKDDPRLAELEAELDTKKAEIEKLKEESHGKDGGAAIDEEAIRKAIKSDLKKKYQEKIDKLKADLEKAKQSSAKDKAEIQEEEVQESAKEGPVEKPEDLHDIEAWEGYLEENPDDKDAHKVIINLEKEAREKNDWKLLSEVLICRFDFAIFENDAAGVAMIREVSQINEIELGDLQNAFHSLKLLLDIHPDDEELLKDLSRIAGEGGLWQLFVDELSGLIPNLTDDDTAAKLWFAIARAYNERLKNPISALAALDEALDWKSDFSEALDEKANIFKKQEEWEKLILTLEKRLKLASENGEKAFYLREIGTIKENELKEPIMAARTFEEVFTVVPDDVETILALESIYRSHDLYEPLSALLQRKIESVDNAEDARIARRDLGFLYAKELDEPVRAIDILEHLVEVLDKDIKLHRVLADLYEGTGRTRGYLKTANRLAELTEMEGEKITLYKRIATELQLNPSTRIKAAYSLEKVLEIKPELEDVYESLEDIYEQEEQFGELVDILRRHIEIIGVDSTKAKLFRKMGKIYLDKLEDAEAAIIPLETSYELKISNVKTMEFLSKAYRMVDEHEKNIPILERLTEKLEGEKRAVALEHLGFSLLKMNEIDRAEEALHKSLAFNENSFAALSSLGEIYDLKSEWTRAVSYYERALKATKNRLDQGDLVFKAASILSDNLNSREKAVELFEELLEISPGHSKAVRVLAEYYYDKENWEKASPLFHIITTELDSLAKKEQVELYIKAGKISLAVDEVEKAADYLEKARELEPTSLHVLIELAELRYRREEWDGAMSLYQALLVAHRDSISTENIAEIYCKLGGIKQIKGDTLKAISFYDKALEIDPGNDDASNAVIKLREDNEDYDTVAKIKTKKIAKEKDLDKKLEMMSDLIRFYIDIVKDPDAAIGVQEEAIELKPNDRGIINDALDLYHLCERWDKVVAAVLKLALLEEPGLLRSKYHYSAGLIYLEELGDDDGALEQFAICLDQDSENEEVFEKIMIIHEKREDWHNMVKAIRSQLKRDPNAKTNIGLWDKLGNLYLVEMGDLSTAIAAFEGAANLEPSVFRSENLAKLYVQAGPDYYEKAEKAYFHVLSKNPEQIETINNVMELAKSRTEKDIVWNLCGVLGAYGRASKNEKMFYNKYHGTELKKATSIITDDMWPLLQSSEEDLDLNKILSGIGHTVSLKYALTHKEFGINRKEIIKIGDDSRAFAQAYDYVSKTLLIKKRPELYPREGLPIMVQMVNLKKDESLIPSWFIEEKRFNRMSEMEAAYYVARELPYLRPERMLRRLAPTPKDLFNAIYAFFKVVIPKKAPSFSEKNKGDILELEKYIKLHVPAATLDSLQGAAERFVKGDFEKKISRWISGNHKTSLRAATLITGDLKHTLSWVLAEKDNVSNMKAKDRLSEVMKFVLSSEYYELRERLGLSI
jgi:tetratricopeptide (TPR) repeat protein